jgi:hypothetical protein
MMSQSGIQNWLPLATNGMQVPQSIGQGLNSRPTPGPQRMPPIHPALLQHMARQHAMRRMPPGGPGGPNPSPPGFPTPPIFQGGPTQMPQMPGLGLGGLTGLMGNMSFQPTSFPTVNFPNIPLYGG